MRKYKITDGNYLKMIGEGSGGTEITDSEYNEIKTTISNKPTPPEGYDYRLKTDLTWELVAVPPVPPDPTEEAEPEDYVAALNRLGVET